jgi:o-succinylbenzoate---CoA ligase
MSSEPVIRFLDQTYTFSGFASFCKKNLKDESNPNRFHLYRFFSDWADGKESFTAITSGSTGDPKPIAFTRRQMELSARSTLNYLILRPGTEALLCLPVQFIAGMMMIVRAWVGALNLVIIDPVRYPLRTVTSRPGFAAMTPMQVRCTLDEHETNHFPDKLIIGGAPLPQGLTKELRKMNTEIYLTYGMTETITHIALQQIAPVFEPLLRPLPGVRIRQDHRGCLVADVPWRDDPVTTNDLIDPDPSGAFRWLGRTDHVINSGGLKIIPEEYERVASDLFEVPFFVYGREDELLGSRLVLFVEKERISQDEESEIKQNIRNSKNNLLVPSTVIIVPEFVYTGSGKINRDLTVDRYREQLYK